MESISLNRGFTLVELMVVLTIVTIITMVVLTSQSSFNKTLILANTSYDIALTLRSAQTYGISGRAIGGTVNAGYGLHFQNGATGTFVFFADIFPAASCDAPDCKPGNKVYENVSDAIVQSYALGNGMTISDFCAKSGGSWSCASSGGITSLDIVFARPNPDSFMSVNGLYSVAFPVTAACLTISSPQGGSQYISVMASGQINADAPSCP